MMRGIDLRSDIGVRCVTLMLSWSAFMLTRLTDPLVLTDVDHDLHKPWRRFKTRICLQPAINCIPAAAAAVAMALGRIKITFLLPASCIKHRRSKWKRIPQVPVGSVLITVESTSRLVGLWDRNCPSTILVPTGLVTGARSRGPSVNTSYLTYSAFSLTDCFFCRIYVLTAMEDDVY